MEKNTHPAVRRTTRVRLRPPDEAELLYKEFHSPMEFIRRPAVNAPEFLTVYLPPEKFVLNQGCDGPFWEVTPECLKEIGYRAHQGRVWVCCHAAEID